MERDRAARRAGAMSATLSSRRRLVQSLRDSIPGTYRLGAQHSFVICTAHSGSSTLTPPHTHRSHPSPLPPAPSPQWHKVGNSCHLSRPFSHLCNSCHCDRIGNTKRAFSPAQGAPLLTGPRKPATGDDEEAESDQSEYEEESERRAKRPRVAQQRTNREEEEEEDVDDEKNDGEDDDDEGSSHRTLSFEEEDDEEDDEDEENGDSDNGDTHIPRRSSGKGGVDGGKGSGTGGNTSGKGKAQAKHHSKGGKVRAMDIARDPAAHFRKHKDASK